MNSDAEHPESIPDSRRILLIVTGGIAACKSVELTRLLIKSGAEVRVLMTEHATRFVQPNIFAAITGSRVGLALFHEGGEPDIDHLEFPHWAELIVVAPATANCLAKMAGGLADDLVSTALLAARCPVLVAPAMNTSMWENPATRANMDTLLARGIHQVGPESGELASPGEEPGMGRMAEPEAIFRRISSFFTSVGSLAGKRIVITAGRTEEPIDSVRFISNHSSGRMAISLAKACLTEGADVVFVHGGMDSPPPSGVQSRKAMTALQMKEAVSEVAPDSDVIFYAAAVSDWRPERLVEGKLKKDKNTPRSIILVENPDVAAETSKLCPGVTIGFALEEKPDFELAVRKRKAKSLDVILLNTLPAMGASENQVFWIGEDNHPVPSPRSGKEALGQWIITRLCDFLEHADK